MNYNTIMTKINRIKSMVIFLIFIVGIASTQSYNFKLGTGARNIIFKSPEDLINKPQHLIYRTIDSIPAPPGEMKMGLAEQGSYLWIFTNNTDSCSIFYKIRKSDGAIVRQFNFPDTTTRYNIGLTMIDNHLYTSEFFPVSGNVHILDTLGNLVRTFNTGYDTRGLAWDGTYLWATEADSQSIFRMDTIGHISAVFKNNGDIQWFMDITWDDYDSTLWANDDAFVLDINELSVASSPFFVIQNFDHPSSQTDIPEGITYASESDGGYLYTSSAYSAFIWKIKVHDGSIAEKNPGYESTTQFGPITPTTFTEYLWICYSTPDQQHIRITVYGVDGRKVNQIIDGFATGGVHKIVWNGRDINNNILPPGIYFIEFKSKNFSAGAKVIKLR